MKKEGFIKKIKEGISKFLEEEPENEEEEINFKTLTIIFLIGFIIIISIYVYTNQGLEFLKFGLDKTEDIEQANDKMENLEITKHFEEYLVEGSELKNSDFSEGMNHWSTSGGDTSSKNSIPKITLNKKNYHSAPQSLQIYCPGSSCNIYYDTKPQSITMNNQYSLESMIWMGVKPGTKLEISYWYQGGKHMIMFPILDKYGDFDHLEGIINLNSKKWTKKEISISIPEGIIAFGVEITLGHNCYLRVDDIQLKIV